MMLRSASRRALEALRERESAVFADGMSAETLRTTSAELYELAALLVGQPRLRRTLGDPATAADGRATLIANLLSGRVSPATLELARTTVSQRWSTPWDMTDALESAGDDALFAAAESEGSLDGVEDELFRFERILESEGELTGLLDETSVEASRRNGLLDAVLAQKVSPITLELLRHAVASARKRSIIFAVDDLIEKAAARRERSIARVSSAVALSAAQQDRLVETLSQLYGRPITVRTAVEPGVRGGLVIRVGDEVIDGSIATRFAHVRNALAG